MQLNLTDEEADALLGLLNRAIVNDPMSPRVKTLRDIRAKFLAGETANAKRTEPETKRRRAAKRHDD